MNEGIFRSSWWIFPDIASSEWMGRSWSAFRARETFESATNKCCHFKKWPQDSFDKLGSLIFISTSVQYSTRDFFFDNSNKTEFIWLSGIMLSRYLMQMLQKTRWEQWHIRQSVDCRYSVHNSIFGLMAVDGQQKLRGSRKHTVCWIVTVPAMWDDDTVLFVVNESDLHVSDSNMQRGQKQSSPW